MLSVTATKAIVLVLMTMLTLCACFLPILVRRVAAKALQRDGMKMFMSGCLCFGGGVLLATVFLHLLPETRITFEEATNLGFLPPMAYPLTELVVCLGFFFVYVVEEVVHGCVSRSAGHGHGHSHMGPLTAEPVPSKSAVKETAIDWNDDAAAVEKFLPEGESAADDAGASKRHLMGVATLRAMMVVVALSLHSIMEGLALGLVHTSKGVWMLFGALSAHKLIIAFCMGMELLTSGVSRLTFFLSLTIFAVASPLGGLCGTLVLTLSSQTTAAGVLVPTVLHGLSAGTLLYVSFCEILERERAGPDHRTIKLVGLVGGFLLMALLQILDVMVDNQPIDAHDGSDSPLAVLTTLIPVPAYSPVPEPYDPAAHG